MSKSNPQGGITKPRAGKLYVDPTDTRSRLSRLAAGMHRQAQPAARRRGAVAIVERDLDKTAQDIQPLRLDDAASAEPVILQRWQVRWLAPVEAALYSKPAPDFPSSLPEQVISDAGVEWHRWVHRPRAAGRSDFQRALDEMRLRHWMEMVMRDAFLTKTPTSWAMHSFEPRAHSFNERQLPCCMNHALHHSGMRDRLAGSPALLKTLLHEVVSHVLMQLNCDRTHGRTILKPGPSACHRACMRKPRGR